MKKVLLTLSLGGLLSGCATTLPLPKTWNEYGQQERMSRVIKNAEPRAMLGEPKGKKALALAYSFSPSQQERKKAAPLLKELAALNDKEAMYFYAMNMLEGTFGVVSDEPYNQYADLIEEDHAGIKAEQQAEVAKWRALYQNAFPALKAVYGDAFPLCEQPLEGMPAVLSPSTSYLIPSYLNTCLTRYSNGYNAADKLLAKAKFQALYCQQQSGGKRCPSEGYTRLANNDLNIDDDKALFVTAAVMRSVYQAHETSFKKYEDTHTSLYLSGPAQTALSKSLDKLSNDDYDAAIGDLTQALKKPKLSEYDKAYLEQMLGYYYGGKANNNGDQESKPKCTEYMEKALARNILSPVDSQKLEIAVSNWHLSQDNPKEYMAHMATLFLERDELHLIPKETLTSMISLWGHHQPTQPTQTTPSE